MGVPKMKSHTVSPPGAFILVGGSGWKEGSAMCYHSWIANSLCICSLFQRWNSNFSPQVIPCPLAHVLRRGLAGQGLGREIDTGPIRQNPL